MFAITFFYLLALFLLGAIIGSFLNVVAVDSMKVYMREKLYDRSETLYILRQLASKSFWKHLFTHRSSCDTCDVVLTPKELVPVVSYLWQKGKCRSCETSFAPQHLYVELIAGVMFLLVFLQVFNSYEVLSGLFIAEVFYMFVFFSLALLLMIFDYEHMIVPNVLVYPMVVMAFGAQLFGFVSVPQITVLESLIAAVILALPLFLFWLVSKGTWMGMADSKIALVMGALLGFSLGFTAWIFSFWIGAAVSIVLVMIARRNLNTEQPQLTMKSAIPFGPFLILAMWFVYISGFTLFIL